MKDRMKWFCTVGYKHTIRVFINNREDKVKLKLRLRNHHTVGECDVTCPEDLRLFLHNFSDHMKKEQAEKLNEIKAKLEINCHDCSNRKCIKERDIENEENDDDYEESEIKYFISFGLI